MKSAENIADNLRHCPLTTQEKLELAWRKAKQDVVLSRAQRDLLARIPTSGVATQAPIHRPLNEIATATLVMEMLKRGFAVMKLPADGGPPETLRDG